MPVREIHVSYGEPASGAGNGSVTIKDAKSINALMAPLLEREACEVAYVICLTTKMEVIGYHQVSRGSLDATIMHPREVFKAAVLVNAANVILVHNHPSGDPAPSGDDFAVTVRMRDAGRLMGIHLLDHVIVGCGGRFASMKDRGCF